jgi:hypothetical protein
MDAKLIHCRRTDFQRREKWPGWCTWKSRVLVFVDLVDGLSLPKRTSFIAPFPSSRPFPRSSCLEFLRLPSCVIVKIAIEFHLL